MKNISVLLALLSLGAALLISGNVAAQSCVVACNTGSGNRTGNVSCHAGPCQNSLCVGSSRGSTCGQRALDSSQHDGSCQYANAPDSIWSSGAFQPTCATASGATGICRSGQCAAACIPGTACEDGDLCTTGETCGSDMVCRGGAPKTCEAPDACHDAGACNPSTGQCSNPSKSLFNADGSLASCAGSSGVFTKDLGKIQDGGGSLQCKCYRSYSSAGALDLEKYFCVSEAYQKCPQGEGDYCLLFLNGPGCVPHTILEERHFQPISPVPFNGREFILDPALLPTAPSQKPPVSAPANNVQKSSFLEKVLWNGLAFLTSWISEAEAQPTSVTTPDLVPNDLLDGFLNTLPAETPPVNGPNYTGHLSPDLARELQDMARREIRDLGKYIVEHPSQADSLAGAVSLAQRTEAVLENYIQFGQKASIPLELADYESVVGRARYSSASGWSIRLSQVVAGAAEDVNNIEVALFEGAVPDPANIRNIQGRISEAARGRLFQALKEFVGDIRESPLSGQSSAGGMGKSADNWIYRNYYLKKEGGLAVTVGQGSAIASTTILPSLEGMDLSGVQSIRASPRGDTTQFEMGRGFRVIFEQEAPGAMPSRNGPAVWSNQYNNLVRLGEAANNADGAALETAHIREAQIRYGVDPDKIGRGGFPSVGGASGLSSIGKNLREIGSEIRNIPGSIRSGRLMQWAMDKAPLIEFGAMAATLVVPLIADELERLPAGGEKIGDEIFDGVHNLFGNLQPRCLDAHCRVTRECPGGICQTTTCLTADCNTTRVCPDGGECTDYTYHPCPSGICLQGSPSGGAEGSGGGGNAPGPVGGNNGPVAPQGGAEGAGGGGGSGDCIGGLCFPSGQGSSSNAPPTPTSDPNPPQTPAPTGPASGTGAEGPSSSGSGTATAGSGEQPWGPQGPGPSGPEGGPGAPNPGPSSGQSGAGGDGFGDGSKDGGESGGGDSDTGESNCRCSVIIAPDGSRITNKVCGGSPTVNQKRAGETTGNKTMIFETNDDCE